MQKTIETARFIINDLREKKGITDIDTFVFRLRNCGFSFGVIGEALAQEGFD